MRKEAEHNGRPYHSRSTGTGNPNDGAVTRRRGALSSPANVEEFLRTLWAQKTNMKTTIALALLLSLSTIAADARAYFFQCGPTKVTVSAYGERTLSAAMSGRPRSAGTN